MFRRARALTSSRFISRARASQTVRHDEKNTNDPCKRPRRIFVPSRVAVPVRAPGKTLLSFASAFFPPRFPSFPSIAFDSLQPRLGQHRSASPFPEIAAYRPSKSTFRLLHYSSVPQVRREGPSKVGKCLRRGQASDAANASIISPLFLRVAARTERHRRRALA